MIRAALLVPDPSFPEAWNWAFDVEAAALRDNGFAVEARAWSNPEDLDAFDVVLPIVAWGYQWDLPRWNALLDRLERGAAAVLNPVPVLRWNTHKGYLTDLAAKGIATIPTVAVAALDEDSIAAAREALGAQLVVKPPVSAAAYGTFRLGPGDAIPDEALGREMLVQPFVASVIQEGEYSLLFFGGTFSHALVKNARAGDYRVQPHLGGTETPCSPPEGAIALATAALAAAPEPCAYARVDMLRLGDGSLALIELELIEPSLWLEHAPDKGESFAAAIAERLAQ